MYEPPNPAALEARYALGLGAANWQGTRRFSHGGGGFGFNSNMIWYPDLKLEAVVLSNVEDAGSAIQIIEDLLGIIITAPFWLARAILQRVRRKNSSMVASIVASPPGNWLIWEEILIGLASLSSLFCMEFIVFILDLIYVPWPRPYADLTWWQYSFLSLPFTNLLMGVMIALIAGLTMRNHSLGSAVRLYDLIVALALLRFNVAIIL